jgi:hypothetical protein
VAALSRGEEGVESGRRRHRVRAGQQLIGARRVMGSGEIFQNLSSILCVQREKRDGNKRSVQIVLIHR